MQSPETFWDKVAHKYAKSPIRNMAAYDQTMDRTRAHLDPDHRALELGCGTGTTALRLADAVRHLVATDISSQMIGIAQTKARDQGVENVTFRRAALTDPADPDGPFDVVMAFNLLHLLDDLPSALGAIAGMVKPGGLFISKSACIGEKFFYLRPVVAVMQMLGKAPYFARLNIRDLEEQISRAGFTIIETHTFPGIIATRFIVARKA